MIVKTLRELCFVEIGFYKTLPVFLGLFLFLLRIEIEQTS